MPMPRVKAIPMPRVTISRVRVRLQEVGVAMPRLHREFNNKPGCPGPANHPAARILSKRRGRQQMRMPMMVKSKVLCVCVPTFSR